MIRRLLTKNFKQVPLFWVTFNYQLFKKIGSKHTCTFRVHPNLQYDEYIQETLNNLVDYIRNKYDMKEML